MIALLMSLTFQLTPSRRATSLKEDLVGFKNISTHALTEGDVATPASTSSVFISTHALTEGDGDAAIDLLGAAVFQLTPSRRATILRNRQLIHLLNFNSRPHGGRRGFRHQFAAAHGISTHALTEGDRGAISAVHQILPFQLTPSRRATKLWPYGYNLVTFQLTPSRRATFFPHTKKHHLHKISTHALTEGDAFAMSISFLLAYFNSRPHGGRRLAVFVVCWRLHISTHALTEGDFELSLLYTYGSIFQLTPSRRATRASRTLPGSQFHFNSRPHGGRPR